MNGRHALDNRFLKRKQSGFLFCGKVMNTFENVNEYTYLHANILKDHVSKDSFSSL